MVRLIGALMLVLLVASPGFGQQSLVGTYKLVSHDVTVDGAPLYPLGKAPHGYLTLTPTLYIAFYVGDTRKFGTSDAEKAALLDSMTAWSGKYRIEGGKMIISVDASWTGVWTGKDQIRTFTVSGNRLTLQGAPTPFPRDPSKMSTVRQVWEKIE